MFLFDRRLDIDMRQHAMRHVLIDAKGLEDILQRLLDEPARLQDCSIPIGAHQHIAPTA